MNLTLIGYAVFDTAFLVAASAIMAGLLAFAAVGLHRLWPHGAEAPRPLLVWAEFFVIAMPFSVIGVLCGFLTGASRSPVVSATIPALLTLFGALVAYLMTKGRASALLASTAIIAFSSSLIFGSIAGSLERDASEAELTSLRHLRAQAEKELALDVYRTSLGLPALKSNKSGDTSKDGAASGGPQN